jgi:gamma-tubulin complex component 2
MMVEVIEPNWHKFEAAFRQVRTVDEVLKIHTDFVDSCLNECMLTDAKLVRVGVFDFIFIKFDFA